MVRKQLLSILLIEDKEGDQSWIPALLGEMRDYEVALERESGREAIGRQARRGVHDVALLSYDSNQERALEIVEIIRRDSDVPVIFLAGGDQYETDIIAARAGAYDYLHKSQLNALLLERSIRYVIRHYRSEAAWRLALTENQRLAAAIDNLTTGLFITDFTQPENPILFVNPAFSTITGYSPMEATGRSWRMLDGPGTDPKTKKAIEEALAAQQPFHAQILHYRKDGTAFWNELRLNPLWEGGRVLRWAGLMEDVSYRVESEIWNQQVLADLGERVKELSTLHNVARTLQTENLELDNLLIQVVNHIPFGFQRPEDVSVCLTFAGHEYSTPDFSSDANGETLEIAKYPLRLSDGSDGQLKVFYRAPAGFEGTLFMEEERGMLNSIVEMLRLRLEQELAATVLQAANAELESRVEQRTQELHNSEERLRRINREILQLSQYKVPRDANPENIVRAFTEAAMRSMDIERATVWLLNEERTKLRCLDACISPDNQHSSGAILPSSVYPEDYMVAEKLRVLTIDDLAQCEHCHLEHLDAMGAASLLVAPILQSGSTIGIFTFARLHQPRPWAIEDQTYAASLADLIALELEALERYKTQDSLRIANEKAEIARRGAESANHAKSEFLSRMSHELRTPLNSILGFSQLLQRDDINDKQHERVDLIVSAGQHLLVLINEVLDIARVESGDIALSLEPVSVNEVLGQAISLITPLAARRKITIEDLPETNGIFMLADRQKLAQIFLNLLSNAVKYNDDGGGIRIRHEETSGNFLQISVANSGRGIAPDDLPRVFLPFERLAAAESEIEGTGLGLALAQSLAQAMGGEITAQSTPGVETIFSVRLPTASAPSPAIKPAVEKVALRHSASPQITVLYIEDNTTNLKLVESIFADQQNIRLISAMQGGLGLELAREHLPDLILLDVHLPDMEGDEVLKRLKSEDSTKTLPVIVLSADATDSRIRQLRALGAQDYLTKPLDIEKFLESIERAIQTKAS